MNKHSIAIALLVTALAALAACIDGDSAASDGATSPGSGEPETSLRVIASAPAQGEQHVDVASRFVLLRFSEPVVSVSDSLRFTAGQWPVEVQAVMLEEDGRHLVKVVPERAFEPNTEYALRVSAGLEGPASRDGHVLERDFLLTFRTAGR